MFATGPLLSWWKALNSEWKNMKAVNNQEEPLFTPASPLRLGLGCIFWGHKQEVKVDDHPCEFVYMKGVVKPWRCHEM